MNVQAPFLSHNVGLTTRQKLQNISYILEEGKGRDKKNLMTALCDLCNVVMLLFVSREEEYERREERGERRPV